ncbi:MULTISPECIES: hypothetical protein [Legionella]|uniref:Uncharacterized protein n=1 Tax=Legionella septentrionalis TaxID=2498109 RepID=A0A433JL31_9GAMM|nr:MULTISPECIES: hypothetical protein [Legionella]MCP0914172.1 hypothetical protein [Legionella sp. 27cVA30]RUQ89249.1 hypothetical protein EKM59_03995 [Legionella septentrionalis]RUQ94616.1 hypothetical protein ELY11_10995 [Legionella septentrionalis]RUR11717.1 hypothetical protein ELY14_00275 [Legionella septentrionalis]RUR17405.1 hypothetical protein ELY10_00275 [Legionella septentrionalis]
MKEKHFAYKITRESSDLVCTHHEFAEDKMLDLLKEIAQSQFKGIYWIFKQLDGKPQEALCIIDCAHSRIYYHYSGEVERLEDTIRKLSQQK